MTDDRVRFCRAGTSLQIWGDLRPPKSEHPAHPGHTRCDLGPSDLGSPPAKNGGPGSMKQGPILADTPGRRDIADFSGAPFQRERDRRAKSGGPFLPSQGPAGRADWGPRKCARRYGVPKRMVPGVGVSATPHGRRKSLEPVRGQARRIAPRCRNDGRGCTEPGPAAGMMARRAAAGKRQPAS
jgi:hypothetical protein